MPRLRDSRRTRGEAAEQALIREIEAEIAVNPGLRATGISAKDLATSQRIFGGYARHREAGFPGDPEPGSGDKNPLKRQTDKTPLGDLWRSIDNMHKKMDANEKIPEREMLHILRRVEDVVVPTLPFRQPYRRDPPPFHDQMEPMKRRPHSKVG